MKYFKRNLEDSNFIDFDSIEDETIKYRINNQAEIFHRLINQTIEFSHSKISFLEVKLYSIIRNKYSEYIINENRISNNTYEKYNI